MDTQKKSIEEILEKKKKEVKRLDLSAENTLDVISQIVFVVGIISTIFCLFTIVFVDSGKYSFPDLEFNPMGLVTTIGVLLGSLTIWALLRVVCDISANLKEINSKID